MDSTILRTLRAVACGAAAFTALSPIATASADELTYQRFETCRPLAPHLTACYEYFLVVEFGTDHPSPSEVSGEKFVNTSHAKEAIAAFDQAVSENPKDEAAYIGRGIAYAVENYETSRAIANFNDALSLNPNSVPALLGRGNAYFARGDDDLALTDYKAAEKLAPTDSNIYVNRGSLFRREGKLDEAIAEYSRAIELNPQNSIALLGRSAVYQGKGDEADALKDLESLRKIDPSYSSFAQESYEQSLRLAAQAIDCKASFTKAMVAFDKLIAAAPKRDIYYDDRARCYVAHGDDASAIADMTTAISLGNDSNVWVERAEAEARLGQTDKAISDYSALIKNKSPMVGSVASEPYLNRGLLYLGKGELDAAIGDFDAGISLDGQNAALFLARGRAHEMRKETAAALRDFDRSISIAPTADAYVARGNLNQAQRDYRGAIADYSNALGLSANDTRALTNRCFARAAENIDLDKAESDCGAVLMIDRANVYAQSNLGLVYLRLARFVDAVNSYDLALQGNPRLAWALYGRGISKLRKSDASGNADLQAARNLDPGVDALFAGMNLQP